MLTGSAPEGFDEIPLTGPIPADLALAAAWADGASRSADWDGRADTSGCPYTDADLASAWLSGAEEPRDIHGDVSWDAYWMGVA